MNKNIKTCSLISLLAAYIAVANRLGWNIWHKVAVIAGTVALIADLIQRLEEYKENRN